jgi:DNA polymerase-3 subunit alpha
MENAMEQASRRQADRDAGQTSLFGKLAPPKGGKGKPAAAPLPEVPPWTHDEMLRAEKEALGFFITGHPLDHFKSLIERFATVDGARLREIKTDKEVRIAALITSLDKKMTKTGKPWAAGAAEDLTATFRVTLFAEALEKSAAALENVDQPVLLFGKVDVRDGGNGLLVEKAIPLVKAAELCSNEVHLRIRTVGLSKAHLQRLAECVNRHPGSCRAYIHLELPDGREATFALPARQGLRPTEDLAEDVRAIFGPGALTFR